MSAAERWIAALEAEDQAATEAVAEIRRHETAGNITTAEADAAVQEVAALHLRNCRLIRETFEIDPRGDRR